MTVFPFEFPATFGEPPEPPKPFSPIYFPLVAEILVQYLSSGEPQQHLASVPDVLGNQPISCVVQGEVPDPRPNRLVVIATAPTAGPQRLTLSTRRIICQIYEQSEYVTGNLAEKARGLIVDAMYRGLGIKNVKVIGEPARFPAPGTPWRWQFTADVMVRAIGAPWS